MPKLGPQALASRVSRVGVCRRRTPRVLIIAAIAKWGICITTNCDGTWQIILFFSNIRYYFEGFYLSYWTGTEFTPELGWTFFFANGHQGWGLDTFHYGFAWAVHDGDVGASLVPEPETYAMMSIGLLALFGFIRLRQQSEPQNNP